MNSIRTPKEGTTVSSRRIAKAVDNEDWQWFRTRSLKGVSTRTKLQLLMAWYEARPHSAGHATYEVIPTRMENCDTCIQVDNYLKALCRGGQLEPGTNLVGAIRAKFIDLTIRK
jgi:hypothetical protein